MHVNSFLCPGVWTLSAIGEIYTPFSGFWCGVSKTAPKLFPHYSFSIAKRNNFLRKKSRIWEFLPTPLLQFKCFFEKNHRLVRRGNFKIGHCILDIGHLLRVYSSPTVSASQNRQLFNPHFLPDNLIIWYPDYLCHPFSVFWSNFPLPRPAGRDTLPRRKRLKIARLK
jgi:hypothetical protein